MGTARYRCQCDEVFSKKDAFIAHHNREHREEGAYGLWDALGETGNEYYDKAMQVIHAELVEAKEKTAAAEIKARAYDALVPRFNALANLMSIVSLAIEGAKDQLRERK